MNNFILKLRMFAEFLVVYSIYLLFIILPVNLTSNLGKIILKKIGPFTKANIIVKKNLKIIFPTHTNYKIKKLALESWSNTGRTFFELLSLPKIMKQKNKIYIEGKENLYEVRNKKEKVVFIGIHQSNWEILLPSIDKLGIPVGGIYRHINNTLINNLILKIRRKSIVSKKSFYTPKGKKSAKEILEGIKKNISMVLLIDQKDSAGDLVDFFGTSSKTQTGFIKIAKKYNMKIIPVQNIRNKNNTFTLRFLKPITKHFNNVSDTKEMEDIHTIVEKWIIKNPTEWFLQHNRFN